jgi:hypothetical protein
MALNAQAPLEFKSYENYKKVFNDHQQASEFLQGYDLNVVVQGFAHEANKVEIMAEYFEGGTVSYTRNALGDEIQTYYNVVEIVQLEQCKWVIAEDAFYNRISILVGKVKNNRQQVFVVENVEGKIGITVCLVNNKK